MPTDACTRRSFLEMSGLAAGLYVLKPLALAGSTIRSQGPFVRQSIKAFMMDAAKVTALRNGVAEMKRRSQVNPSDRTGWRFQANIHGSACQHANWFFFPWHRAYLYYFERILRAASGDSSLALPYWDWSDPAQRALPLIFKQPSGMGNSLWHSRNMNGNQVLSPSAVQTANALAKPTFTGSYITGGFGGPQRNQSGGSSNLHGFFERYSHDDVHSLIGQDMGDVDLAAQDPIFWVHHANVDRFWKIWLRQGTPRDHPRDPMNPAMLHPDWKVGPFRRPFTFYDEMGVAQPITVEKVLDTVTDLNYRYDDDPNMEVAAQAPAKKEAAAMISSKDEFEASKFSVLAASKQTKVALGAKQTFTLEIPDRAKTTLNQTLAAEAKSEPLYLSVEGIDYPKNPGVFY